MPIYSYTCPKCQYVFDNYSPVVSENPRPCPKCGTLAVLTFSVPGRVEMKGPKWNA